MKWDWTDGPLGEGLRCYRSGEYFEAHEHWEAVWLGCEDPQRTFLQSLIQISAAFHHLGRGNVVGAQSLLRRALTRLERYPDTYNGVDVEALRAQVAECLRCLARAPQVSSLTAPHIL